MKISNWQLVAWDGCKIRSGTLQKFQVSSVSIFTPHFSLMSNFISVFDHKILRRVAEAYGLTDFVFFGCNGDPVVACTAATIVKKLTDVKGKKMCWGGNWDRAVPVPGKVSAVIDDRK